jgi:sugar lactone lactonase YvrE
MIAEVVSTVERLIAPPAAPEALVEDAGRAVRSLWWDERDDSLWWSEGEGSRLFRLNLRTRIQSAVYEGPPVAAFLPQEDGKWLLFREKDIADLDFDRHEPVATLIPNVRFDGDSFTHLVADETGRVLIGTLRNGRPNGAGLYRIDPDGTMAKVLGGTGHVAGLAWNEKRDSLFWTCATTKTICRCRYESRRGTLTNRQVFHECLPDEGTPGALAFDEEGTLWSARRDAGVILKIAPDRRLMGQVTLPAPHVTSLAFGGPDRRTLFVSTQAHDGASKIFHFQAPAPGRPAGRARIDGKPIA